MMIVCMINLPIYSDKKLITAFEYGVVIADVAKEQGIKLTPEIIARMEKIIKNEFRKKDWKRVNLDMIVNILASFEK